MDFQALANLFATTYNANPNIQKAGELQIRKVRPHLFWSSTTDPDVLDRCPRGRLDRHPANHCI